MASKSAAAPLQSFHSTFNSNDLSAQGLSYNNNHQDGYNNFGAGLAASNPFPNQNAQMAGLGGATSSDLEKMLQNEIDLIFIFLCKYGRIWPLASEYIQRIGEIHLI